MEQEGISVIVPILNAEKYIEECLESIASQGDVVKEIICVDDGSLDSSKQIVESVRCRDSRVKLIESGNQGVSVARNIGLNWASGRYIMFVDADDYLQGKKLKKLYQLAISKGADVLVFGGTTNNSLGTPHWVRKVLSPQNGQYQIDNEKDVLTERGFLPVVWNKLYRKEVIKNLRFPIGLNVAEDNAFGFFVHLEAGNVVFSSTRIYVYRLHEESVMQRITEKNRIQQHELAVKLVKHQLQEDGRYEDCQRIFNKWKDLLLEEKTDIPQGKIAMLLYYYREYGMRSLIECLLGKIQNKIKS